MKLISKKDLLAATGISYGQLYRWKRQRLIPEEWFIKQSSYTGQETFFPREQMLSRVQSILELKDRYSMEELAELLSPQLPGVHMDAAMLAELGLLSETMAGRLPELLHKEQLSVGEAVLAAVVFSLCEKAGLEEKQTAKLLSSTVPPASTAKVKDAICTLYRTGGECHVVLSPMQWPPVLDSDCEMLGQCDTGITAETVKIKMNERKEERG